MKNNQGKQKRRLGFRRLIASVTAVSMILGSSYFAMAANPEPVYICGMEEHAHTGEKGDCYEVQRICGLEEDIMHECSHEQGFAHKHDDSCYEYGEPYLDCGVEVEGHMHEDGCYAEVTDKDNLICTEATEVAHEHDDDCATDEAGTVVCEETVDVVHEHSNSCYGTKTVLECGIEENHFHADSCYTRDKNLVCEWDEHECTHEDCWVPAFDGAHKHSDDCDGPVFVCEKEEHEHVDECIQPDEVTEMLEMLDELNETALLLVEARDVYNEKAEAVAEIEARGNAAVEAGEAQDVIDAIMAEYNEACEELQEAQDLMAKAQMLFNDEQSIARAAFYQLGGEEHPEYQEMISAEYQALLFSGAVMAADANVCEDTNEDGKCDRCNHICTDGNDAGTTCDIEVGRNPNKYKCTNEVKPIVLPVDTDRVEIPVKVQLFNYGGNINTEISSLPVEFYDYSSANSEDGRGNTGTSEKYYTVADQLVYTTDEAGNKDMGFPVANGVSLAPLFNGTVKTESYSYDNGGKLFADNSGRYSYDSKENAAKAGANGFTVYGAPVSGEGDDGHFLPFNAYTGLERIEGGYNLTEDVDRWFGMTVEFQFMMPKNGMINGNPMEFEFYGDDDVMVFIDDCLAIDLSGIHREERGNINFATGDVTLTLREWEGSGTGATRTHPTEFQDPFVERNIYTRFGGATGKYTTDGTMDATTGRFADYTMHTLKFFYLERGGGASNCQMEFNLPTVAENSLTVIKNVNTANVTTGNVVGVDAQQYKFRVMDAATGNVLITKDTEYTLKNSDTDTGTTAYVGEGGYFTLRDGQRAVFEDMQEYEKDYYVEEVLPDDLVDAYNQIIYKASSQGGTVEHDAKPDIEKFNGIRTETLEYDETQIVTFNNKVDADKLGRLYITKTARDGLTGPFRINVQLGNQTIPLTLNAGQTGEIKGILPGTEYEITEVASNNYFGTFTVGSAEGIVPVYTENATDGTNTAVKVTLENRATNFHTDRIKVTKVVNGLPLVDAFEDTFEFKAELIDYAAPGAESEAGSSEQGAVAQAYNALVRMVRSFPDAVENNVAAANGNDKKVSIEVSKGADENVASKAADGALVLNFDKDTPDGVYTYKVTEVQNNDFGEGKTYKSNTQEFIIKVKVDQSKEGNRRAEIIEMTLDSQDVKFLKFTNERNPEYIPVTVQKVWDKKNPDIKQPESVEVQLKVNGKAVGDPVTLRANAENADLSWKYTWEGVVTDTDVWTVEEKAVPKFTTTYAADYENNLIVVTNADQSTVPGGPGGGGGERGSLMITKTVRGDATFANGAVFNMEVTLNGSKIPAGTPYKLNGNAVADGVAEAGIIPMKAGDTVLIEGILADTEYRVTEAHAGGFFATYSNNENKIEANKTAEVSVVNQADAFSVDVPLTKYLFGHAKDTKYTFQFDVKGPNGFARTYDVNLTGNGGAADVNGSTTITLPFTKDTKDDTYEFTVTERDVPGFKPEVKEHKVTVKVEEGKATVVGTKAVYFTNKAVKEVTVEKVWNTAGKATPKSVAVQLYVKDDASDNAAGLGLSTASGWKKSGEVVKLSEENGWRYAWTLEKDLKWKVEEVEVAGHESKDGKWVSKDTTYTTAIKYSEDGLAAKIENTRTVEPGTLTIEKAAKADSDFGNQAFKVEVTFNGVKAEGKYRLYNKLTGTAAGTEKEVTEPGIIELKVGEKAVFEVPAGTTYRVTEAHEGGYYPTYKVNGNSVADAATGTVPEAVNANVLITNQKDTFGVAMPLVKKAFGLADGAEYEFFFDMVQIGNGAVKTESIKVVDPVESDDAYVTATGEFKMDFNRNTKSGTYIFEVTEKAEVVAEGADPVFVPNTQKYTVTVDVDQDAEHRAQITSVKDENGNELISADGVAVVPLTFINKVAPKEPEVPETPVEPEVITQFVTVNKVWANVVESEHPESVAVQLYVMGEEVMEPSGEPVTLNADNEWTFTWEIAEDAEWTVEEVAVAGHTLSEDGTWVAEGTDVTYKTTITQTDAQAIVTNERVVPVNDDGDDDDTPSNPSNNRPNNNRPNRSDDEDDGMVLGATDENKPEEDGMVLGAYDDAEEEMPLIAGVADTGDSKTVVVAGTFMALALVGIFKLRKKKED